MSKTDNPQAFPQPIINVNTEGRLNTFKGETGMSLRDYFAGQALMGICANPSIGTYNTSEISTKYNRTVYTAYKIADAMLKERNKTND